jgi:phage-related protein
MDGKWKVLSYKTIQGSVPVNEFILGLEIKAQTKVYNAINLLRDYSLAVGLPHVKKLTGTDLWELRILGADSIRILYIAVTGKTFLLLHGFKKKKMKTPPKEIKTALERLAEYRARLK